MMGIGFPELMVILVIIMIIFGAGKLPEIGSAFGRSIKNFKTSMKEAEEASGDPTAQAEGEDAAPDAQLNAGDAPASTEEEVTAQLAGSHPSAAPASESTTAPASGSSKPAAQTQTAQTQAPQGKPKPKETPKSEEEKMIEDAINELKEKRIGTIRTPHDGLVQQNDVFTESLKRNPWGRRGDRGVRRDVL